MKPGVLAVDDSVARDIEAQFRAHIADTAFPCVGAKSAQARDLLDVLVACGGSAEGISTYGALKRAVADAVVGVLEPVQRRHADLLAHPERLRAAYDAGEARCREVTAPVLAAAEAAVALAIALNFYNNHISIDVDRADELKG